jgi:hypothetical protein
LTLNGYVATWRGETYEASPFLADEGLFVRIYQQAPTEGFGEVSPDRHVRVVPVDELDELLFRRAKGIWRGHEFFAVARRGTDMLLLEHPANDSAFAESLGLTMVEPGVYRIWVPVSEVTDQAVIDIPTEAVTS